MSEEENLDAKVTRITHYGVYLHALGKDVIVLGPDASPTGDIAVEKLFRVGDVVSIRLGRFSESDHAYRGYIDRQNKATTANDLHPT